MSNDTEQPTFFLNIEGDVIVDVEVTPRHLSFGQLGKNEKATREFKIAVREPEKVKVVEVKIDDDQFVLKKIDGVLESNSTWEITFKGTRKVGRVMGNIDVRFTGSDVTSAKIPARVNIVGDLQYTKSLYFHREGEGYVEREIVFSSRSGKNVHIKKIVDPDGLLEIDLSVPKGKKAIVKTKVADPKGDYSKPSRHVLKVFTGDPDESEVDIRYTISNRLPGRQPHMRNKGMRRGDRGVSGIKAPMGKPLTIKNKKEGEAPK